MLKERIWREGEEGEEDEGGRSALGYAARKMGGNYLQRRELGAILASRVEDIADLRRGLGLIVLYGRHAPPQQPATSTIPRTDGCVRT